MPGGNLTPPALTEPDVKLSPHPHRYSAPQPAPLAWDESGGWPVSGPDGGRHRDGLEPGFDGVPTINFDTLVRFEDYHQQYLAKNPTGYCGMGGTGVSCPVGVA